MSVEKRIAEMERLRGEGTAGEWMAAEAGSSVVGWPIISIPEGHAIASVLSNPGANSAHIVSMQNSQEALLRIVRAAEAYRSTMRKDAADSYDAWGELRVGAWCEFRDALDDFATEAKR